MPRKRKPARDRCAHLDRIHDEFQTELDTLLGRVATPVSNDDRIETINRIIKLFERIADSEVPLWPIVRRVYPDVPVDKNAAEDHAEVLAMIAQIIAPPLAGSSRRRGEETGNKRCRNIIREILGKVTKVKEQVHLYMQKTGRSREDFLLRKKEVENGEFDERDAA